MKQDTYLFAAGDGHKVFCYRWLPEGAPRAVIHIAHGMGEHAGRYHWTAEQLVANGYAVIANDHRGHGKTADVLGQFGGDGWNRAVQDLHELIESHRNAFPDQRVVLFGHSMGAMLTQQYIATHGNSLDAAILSGSPGFGSALQGFIFRLIIRFERWRLGPESESPLLQKVLFGTANNEFEGQTPDPTGFEWLSRDRDQVRAYVDDPLCGFVPCPGSLFDIFAGAKWAQQDSSVDQIPATLPLLVFSGAADPIHNKMKNIDRMLAKYRARGLGITTRFYPDGRHEMLNEIDRDAVIADVCEWLEATV